MDQAFLFELPESTPQRHYVFELTPEEVAERNRQQFENQTALIPELFVDGVLFRHGFAGTDAERAGVEAQLVRVLLEKFAGDDEFQRALLRDSDDPRPVCEALVVAELKRIRKESQRAASM